ncbi:DnaJ domain-containing protein [Altererythrobacter sp.]|uniref:DnaJ domain-containing protein n=1 Tax=Altererythrobacter sp. TaxID=1872480 RepID=UPI003D06C315
MNEQPEFVDYYNVLQVNPKCDARVLEIAYHHHAKKFHPDNLETADTDKFNEVMEAYSILKDREKRALYDRDYANRTKHNNHQFTPGSAHGIDEITAVNDAEMHEKILLHLYKRRREHPKDAGVIAWSLQEMLGCPEDLFDFHIWYLKSKGFVDVTEQGTLAVTIEGVDHVISTSRHSQSEKKLIAKLEDRDD